ncbi:hypothetical protein [Rubrobacter indicoceani]|uniref:hypothetical protein n=1 Tax=Rubrobacter indicoceani TaxID=2051957 RepID=UPI0013C4B8E4|nr:hypothetical protein [Rubrobacter indicoceani]
MKKEKQTPDPSYAPVGTASLILAERDAIRRRDWQAATQAARERAALLEARYNPRTRRTR